MVHSRNKGKNYENHIAKLFREAGWPDAKRHLEFQSDEAEHGRDLDNTEPFAVQVKCWKKAPPITAILQVKAEGEYRIPVAILKRTQSKGVKSLEVAVMCLDDFMRLMEMVAFMGEYVFMDTGCDNACGYQWPYGFVPECGCPVHDPDE